MELDTTKLSQAGSRKLTPHDNCTVLDLDLDGVGSSVYPRLIEIRIPGPDGARQSALWDGSLDLAVDDIVIADQYAGQTIWRVSGIGGDASGAGKVRVSKVWKSGFDDVALSADATGQIGIATAVPGALLDVRGNVHLGNLTFTGDGDGDVSLFGDGTNAQSGAFHSKLKIFGGSSQTRSMELYQVNSGDAFVDVTFGHLEIRTLTGSGDIKFTSINDIIFNDGQMFLQGSDGFLGLGSIVPTSPIYLEFEAQSAAVELRTFGTLGSSFIGQAAGGTKASPTTVASGRLLMRFSAGGYDGTNFSFAQAAMDMVSSEAYTASAQGTYIRFRTTAIGSTSLVTRMTISDVGWVGLNGITAPSTELDIGDGAIEFEEMTAPAAGAANTARLFARDDGDGDTELCVRFSSGLVQVISPLEFGEVSVIENTTATALTITTEAQFLFFDTDGPANGAVPDHTNDHITVGKTGTYLIVASLSVESASGSGYQVEFTVQKNNGATQVGALHAHRAFAGGGGDFGSVSMSGLAVLTAGDTVELWIENLTSSQDVTIEDATLSVAMIGVNA